MCGRQLKFLNPDPSHILYSLADLNVHFRKINNIVIIFGIVGRMNLREHDILKPLKFNRPQKQLEDAVIIEEERQSRSMLRAGIAKELL